MLQLTIFLPKTGDTPDIPPKCPSCDSKRVRLHEVCKRQVMGANRKNAVLVNRYFCLDCKRTFRVYPSGVSAASHTKTLRVLCILLYALGFGYHHISTLLEMMGYLVSEVTVYRDIANSISEVRRLHHQQQSRIIRMIVTDKQMSVCGGSTLLVTFVFDESEDHAFNLHILGGYNHKRLLDGLVSISRKLDFKVVVNNNGIASIVT